MSVLLGETLKRRFCDLLEGTWDLCFLAEQVYWHPILPDPARPFRRAPRPDPLVACPGFRFDRSDVRHKANRFSYFTLVESKTRTYHGRVGSRRTAAWRGEVGQNWTPTEQSAQETSLPRTLQSIEETSSRLPRSTNKQNSMKIDGRTKQVDTESPPTLSGSVPVCGGRFRQSGD